ncbi:GH25 family lysozyme [Ekhidna sp. To15]|uniref:GH25 family lysozyme n=1 Tax=Ekhidna sp. To15 TaxID=3395267 RepID=UPI003F525C92
MRKLSKTEFAWLARLMIARKKNISDTSAFLNQFYFKQALGRGLIIQSDQKYAVLYIKKSVYQDKNKREQEIKQFLELMTFLRYLAKEGMVAFYRGPDTLGKKIHFIQDGFKNPKVEDDKIVFNDYGYYSERPDTIKDVNGNTVYQGIILHSDTFELIFSVSIGSFFVTDAAKKTLMEQKKDFEPKKPKAAEKKKSHISTSKILLALIIVVLLLLNGFSAWHSFHLSKQINNPRVINTSIPNAIQAPIQKNEIDTLFGIDISHWNGEILDAINHHEIEFVICKASEGYTIVDPLFETNWKTLETHSIKKGAYHLYIDDRDPIGQAKNYINAVGGSFQKSYFPPIVDIEPSSLKKGSIVDKDSFQRDLITFLNYLSEYSREIPIIYVDKYFADTYLLSARFKDYHLWLAQYSDSPEPTLPEIWETEGYLMWQKSDSYDLDSQKVDFDLYIMKQ